MKKLLCYLLFFSCTMLQLNAQISAGGTPVSFLYPNVSLNQPEALKMPAFDLEALRAEDFDNDRKGDKPYRFGYEMEVSLNEQNAGVIDYLPNGDKLWRVALKSTDALTINLIFNRFVLPEGAQLFIYNKDHSEIIGAFTEFNNQSDGKLGTTLVSGDEIIVEYYEPSWVDFQGEVEIGTVIHGYRSIAQVLDEVEQRAFGSSGSCNINVNCASGASWATEKRSVGMMVSGGGFCTGALLNNTNNNGTPYFMSANHCYSSGYSTWVYWFNWEAAGCTNPASSPAYNSVSGSSLKARNAASDFMLLQLNSTPPSSYNVHYAGWDRSGTAPTSGAGIHHPSGDIKKISFDNNTFTNSSWSGTPANSHWHVIWDSGVTEPGSSGSPLFDQNRRFVGQLHGGASACGASDLSDEYGKFSLSWDYGTTAATRAKDWLDPAGSNPTTLNGYTPTSGPFLSVTPSNQNVTSTAGSTTFNVSSNVSWTASSAASWLTVSPGSGSNNGTITATYTANTATTTRTGTITVTNGTLTQTCTVTQQGTSGGGGTCSNDNEPANNKRNTAPLIATNTDKYSQIAASNDKDFWKFTLGASTSVTINLSNLPADFDIKLLNSSGSQIAISQNGGTASETISMTLAAGTYYCHVYGYNGAFSTTVCYLLRVNGGSQLAPQAGGKGKNLEGINVEMYPNPSQGNVVVALNNKETSHIQVFDYTGKLIIQTIGAGMIQLDMNLQPAGIYIVRISQGDEIITKKLIIEQ